MFPVAPVPAGFCVQPIDAEEVAGRLVELALGQPAGRVPGIAGPQVTDWVQLLRDYLGVIHRRCWVIQVRTPGTHAVRCGALLPPAEHTEGHRTWQQFLEANLEHRETDRPH